MSWLSRYIFVLFVVGAMFLTVGAFASDVDIEKPEKPERSEEIKKAEAKKTPGPIIITSDSLHADSKKGTATFKGSVVARNDELHMTADIMNVFYSENGEGLDRIVAKGSVKVVSGGRIVTSDRSVYLSSERTMTFTGNARAVENSSVLVGTKIVYDLDRDVFEVEGSRVFIQGMPEKSKKSEKPEKDKRDK